MNKALIAFGLLFSTLMNASATVISVSENRFDDLGKSTVDLKTHLEWRDFNLSDSRTTCSVIKDAGGEIPSGCVSFDNQDLIPNSEGWRLATRSEAAQLLNNWFGTPIDPNGYGSVNGPLSQQFLAVFASGASMIRPNFYPDTTNPAQAIGLFVSYGNYNMISWNGNINTRAFGTALVRDIDLPEPDSLTLLGLALPALAFARRRR
jgi:hypothetical protein